MSGRRAAWLRALPLCLVAIPAVATPQPFANLLYNGDMEQHDGTVLLGWITPNGLHHVGTWQTYPEGSDNGVALLHNGPLESTWYEGGDVVTQWLDGPAYEDVDYRATITCEEPYEEGPTEGEGHRYCVGRLDVGLAPDPSYGPNGCVVPWDLCDPGRCFSIYDGGNGVCVYMEFFKVAEGTSRRVHFDLDLPPDGQMRAASVVDPNLRPNWFFFWGYPSNYVGYTTIYVDDVALVHPGDLDGP